MTAADLVASAQRLAPQFGTRAAEIEHARRIPPDISTQMAQAGFYRMFVPAAHGSTPASVTSYWKLLNVPE